MKKKIAIVEDDKSIRENIALFLEEEGFEVFTAENGSKGVELINKNLPDLILCDISMPVMDGYEVHTSLQKNINTASIPFIFLTAKTQKSDLRKGMNMGVDDYITKPFVFDDLLHAVKSRINKQSTLLKFSEENYRVMIENTLTGIFIISNDIFKYVNSTFSKIIELESSKLIGSSVETVFTSPTFINNIKKSIQDKDKFVYEYLYINPKGEKKYLDIYGGPIRFENTNSFFGIVIDNTQRKHFEKLLQENILLTEERERKRFSEDLHDGLGPLMYNIKLHIDLIKLKTQNIPELAEITNNVNDMIISAIDSTKEIAFNLNPAILDDYGLSNAVNNFIEKTKKIDTINIKFSSNQNGNKINKTCEINFYRIITELINNSIKHAEARSININLKIDKSLIILYYFDNGKGISEETKSKEGFGLKNIEARIRTMDGTLEFLNTISHGFNILITVDQDQINNNVSI